MNISFIKRYTQRIKYFVHLCSSEIEIFIKLERISIFYTHYVLYSKLVGADSKLLTHNTTHFGPSEEPLRSPIISSSSFASPRKLGFAVNTFESPVTLITEQQCL